MSVSFLMAFLMATAFSILWGRFGGRLYARFLVRSHRELPKRKHIALIYSVAYPIFVLSLVGPWLYFVSFARLAHVELISLKFALTLLPAIVGAIAVYYGIKPYIPELRARGMFK